MTPLEAHTALQSSEWSDPVSHPRASWRVFAQHYPSNHILLPATDCAVLYIVHHLFIWRRLGKVVGSAVVRRGGRRLVAPQAAHIVVALAMIGMPIRWNPRWERSRPCAPAMRHTIVDNGRQHETHVESLGPLAFRCDPTQPQTPLRKGGHLNTSGDQERWRDRGMHV